MTISEDIFAVACAYTSPDEEEKETLRRLCAAAEAGLEKRLLSSVSVEDCYDSFVCAAGLMAAADFSAVRAGVGIKSFSAGPVSVSREDGAFAQRLREQAAVMIAPWCQDAFRFLGVQA